MNIYIAIYHFNGFDVNVYGPFPTGEEAYIFIGAYETYDRLTNYPDLTEEEYEDEVCGDGYWDVRALRSPEETLKGMK